MITALGETAQWWLSELRAEIDQRIRDPRPRTPDVLRQIVEAEASRVSPTVLRVAVLRAGGRLGDRAYSTGTLLGILVKIESERIGASHDMPTV